jgi:hypothetical protein
VKPDLLHILWLLLTFSIIIHASPLDTITYDPGYTLKISKTWKSEFFETPFFLRTDSHVRSYDGDSGSPWRVLLHKFFLLGLPWLEYLFGAKKKARPHIMTHFRDPGNVGWFWYILVALVEIYKIRNLSIMVSHIPTMWHTCNHPGPPEGRMKKQMSDS